MNRLDSPRPRCCGRLSRRHVLLGTGTILAGGLAGCLGDDEDEEPAEPIDLAGKTCDACGMGIGEHYGPAGQVFYADGKPEGRDGPAHFDGVVELLASHEERLEQGWKLREVFVTDYSRVDYDLDEREEGTYLSAHPEADAFADATGLSYVVESDVEGAMGAEYVPFSSRDDAEALADEHGGEIRSWEELPGSGGSS